MGEFTKIARQAATEFYSQFSDEQLTPDEHQALIEQYTQDFIDESGPEAMRSLSEHPGI